MTTPSSPDPYLFLEEVDSPEALAWIGERSDRTVADLAAGERAEASQARALRILDATDRIAWPVLRGRFAYNVWKDGDHPGVCGAACRGRCSSRAPPRRIIRRGRHSSTWTRWPARRA
ncbi:hypothetical protein ACFSSF_01800 [Dietzia aerolata]|uniref:hypothetical protein n=1 Tax=Dietzia aerolata TaxID=595984 RepID=UPI00362D45E6